MQHESVGKSNLEQPSHNDRLNHTAYILVQHYDVSTLIKGEQLLILIMLYTIDDHDYKRDKHLLNL